MSSSSSPSDFLVCFGLVVDCCASSDSGNGGEVEKGELEDLEDVVIGITREAEG